MKRIIYLLLASMLLTACQKNQELPRVTSEVTVTVETTEKALNTTPAAPAIQTATKNKRYVGVDFNLLPVNERMLDMWNEPAYDGLDYQYRNASLSMEELNAIAQNDIVEYGGLSPIEQKVVGYWFGLDGVSQADEGISFMDALKKSRYPMLTIYPNGYFVISWSDNSPVYNGTKETAYDALRSLLIRGKWTIRGKKLLLYYYQYLFDIAGEKNNYINLETPFELELIDLDDLSPDNISTKPFAAFTQPPEILERIPEELVFINKPAYFIKSLYTWETDNNATENYERTHIFGIGSFIKSKPTFLDELLTSTEEPLQTKYWF